jgi:hypothetical protein
MHPAATPATKPLGARSWDVNATGMAAANEMKGSIAELDLIFSAQYELMTRVIGRVIHD